MNNKVIVTTLVICFIMLSYESVMALNIEKENYEMKDEYVSVIKDDTNVINQNDQEFVYVFQAYGPVHKMTSINFLDGPDDKISRLNSLFSRMILFPIFSTVTVTNLTFTISFDESVETRAGFRNWYATSIGKIDDPEDITTTINVPHSCTVYEFSGIVKFIRPRIFKFLSIGPRFIRPYRFAFIGYCEDAELNIDSS